MGLSSSRCCSSCVTCRSRPLSNIRCVLVTRVLPPMHYVRAYTPSAHTHARVPHIPHTHRVRGNVRVAHALSAADDGMARGRSAGYRARVDDGIARQRVDRALRGTGTARADARDTVHEPRARRADSRRVGLAPPTFERERTNRAHGTHVQRCLCPVDDGGHRCNV